VEDYADTLIPFADGSLLATVYGITPGPDYSSPVALRFRPDGSLDDSYGVHGLAINPLRSLTVDGGFVQPDGKLVVYGYGGMATGLMARFNPDGSPDASFAGGGFAKTPSDIGLIHTIGAIRLSDGRYLMLVQTSADVPPYSRMAFVMFTATGAVDPTFGDQGSEPFLLGSGANLPASFVQTPNGRAFAAGDYNESGDSQFFVAQFTIGDNLRLSLRNAGGSAGGGGIVTSATNLVFDVVHPDSYYRVYRNGTLISDAYANSAAFTATGQPEGTWDYTVTAVDAAGNESAPGAPVRVTIDTTPPSVLSTQFDPAGSGGSLRVALSEGIVPSPAGTGPGPSLSSLDGGAAAAAALAGSEALIVSYDAGNHALTLNLNGALADGNYRLTIPAAWLRDAAGNPISADLTFDFYVLAGDDNRDRAVDFKDLALVAQNYNTIGGKTWTDGDFNGDGNVDFLDLAILAQRYNTSLPAPAAGGASAASSRIVSTGSGPMPSLASVIAQMNQPSNPATAPGGSGATTTGAKPTPKPVVIQPKPLQKPAVIHKTEAPVPAKRPAAPMIKKVAAPPTTVSRKVTPSVTPPLFSAKKIMVTSHKHSDVLR
jgi:uncharacterized delta-60 repeat protein